MEGNNTGQQNAAHAHQQPRDRATIRIFFILLIMLQLVNVLFQLTLKYALYKCKKRRKKMTTTCMIVFQLSICAMLSSVCAFIRLVIIAMDVVKTSKGKNAMVVCANVTYGLQCMYLLLIILFGTDLLVSAHSSRNKQKLTLRHCAGFLAAIWVFGIACIALLSVYHKTTRFQKYKKVVMSLFGIALFFIFTVYTKLYFCIKYKRKRIIRPGFNAEQFKETKHCLLVRFRILTMILILYVLFFGLPVLLSLFVVKMKRLYVNMILIPLITVGTMLISCAPILFQQQLRKCFKELLQCASTDLGS